MSSRFWPIVYDFSRWLVGGVFLYAGAVKAADVVSFAGEIANYKILPHSFNYLVAVILPYLEILAGTLLLFNVKVRAAALVAGGLNLVFIAALFSVLARGLDIDCGCFGSAEGGSVSALSALIRDLAIMVLIVAIFRLRRNDPVAGRNPDGMRLN